MGTHLDNCPALILNADYRPLSYFPLSLCSWQDAVRAVFMDRVDIVSEYNQEVHAPGFSMRLPSVVVLRDFVRLRPRPAFTRFNVFLRDRWTCQYCGEKFSTHELTFDHVVPRSRGGTTTWENIVAACQCCNLRKGSWMPEECRMFPLQRPVAPTTEMLHRHGRSYPPNFLHESWADFLYWDTELEEYV